MASVPSGLRPLLLDKTHTNTHTRCLTYTNTNTHALSHSYTVDNASVEEKKLIDLSGKELVEGSDSKV